MVCWFSTLLLWLHFFLKNLTNLETTFSLQVHVDNVFTCLQCPTSFKNKTSLKEHVVKHHIGIHLTFFSLGSRWPHVHLFPMSHLLQEQNLAERTRGQAPYRDQELLLRHLRQRVLQQAESKGRRKTILWCKQRSLFYLDQLFFPVLWIRIQGGLVMTKNWKNTAEIFLNLFF